MGPHLVWTKIAKKTFNLKLKLTNRVLTVLLLQKLLRKHTGTNDVELCEYDSLIR